MHRKYPTTKTAKLTTFYFEQLSSRLCWSYNVCNFYCVFLLYIPFVLIFGYFCCFCNHLIFHARVSLYHLHDKKQTHKQCSSEQTQSVVPTEVPVDWWHDHRRSSVSSLTSSDLLKVRQPLQVLAVQTVQLQDQRVQLLESQHLNNQQMCVIIIRDVSNIRFVFTSVPNSGLKSE